MALQFPISPINGQTYQSGSSPIYTYNGVVWELSSANTGIANLNQYTASLKTALNLTGSNTTVLGNLNVQGTQTALNQSSLQITDKFIRVASGSLTSAQSDGAGIRIDGANVTMSWDSANSRLVFNTQISASKYYGDGSGLTGISSYTNSDNLSYLNSKGVISGSSQVVSILSSLNTYTASNDTTNTTQNNRLTSIESVTSSYETKGRNIVSGSSQLTSSYDSRYVISGSITQTTWDNIASKPSNIVSGSSQLTSSYDSRYATSASYLTSINGAISSSSQLTSSYDARYTLSGSISSVPAGTISGSSQVVSILSSLNTYTASNDTTNTTQNGRLTALENKTGSLATTGSNTFNGTQTISGSFALSGSLVYNGINLQNGFAFAQPKNTKILDNSSYTGAASWRASYTGSGGSVIVRADVTGYKAGGGLGSLSLYRDSVSVATQTYYFNLSNTHMALPPLTYVNNNEVGGHTYEVIFSGISADANDFLTIVVSEVTSSAIVAGSLISGSSQLTSSYDTRYVLSGSITQTTWDNIASKPSGIISGSSQLTSSYDGRYLQTASFNSFTASAQTVTTGSNSFNGTQTITGSLIVTTGSFIGSLITANTSSLFLTSGSNLYVQNNGLVEITGSVRITGSNLTYDGTTLKAPYIESTNSIADEGGEFHLAFATTNNTLTGSYVVMDIYQSKLRIFEGGGNSRGLSIDLSKTANSVGGELFWKSSGYVSAGSFVSLDNIKATITSTGNRGLSLAAVSTQFSASYGGTYGAPGGGSGGSSNGQVLMTTTPTTSLFGWNFAGQGDVSTYVVTDTTTSKTYRITLQIGGSYINNFIMIERLH